MNTRIRIQMYDFIVRNKLSILGAGKRSVAEIVDEDFSVGWDHICEFGGVEGIGLGCAKDDSETRLRHSSQVRLFCNGGREVESITDNFKVSLCDS